MKDNFKKRSNILRFIKISRDKSKTIPRKKDDNSLIIFFSNVETVTNLF